MPLQHCGGQTTLEHMIKEFPPPSVGANTAPSPLSREGTYLPGGEHIPAPPSLNCMFSQLSTAFTLIGRTGPWDELGRSGNPINSPEITSYKKGYLAEMHEAGWEQGSAVPYTEADFRGLVDMLDAEASQSPCWFQRVLLDRDALAAAYLWGGGQRGKEGGRLHLLDHTNKWVANRPRYLLPQHLKSSAIFPFPSWTQLCVSASDRKRLVTLCSLHGATRTVPSWIMHPCRDGEPAFPMPDPIPVGYELDVSPNGTKVVRGRRSELAVTFKLEEDTPLQYQYPYRLAQHIKLCGAAQGAQPLYKAWHPTIRQLSPA